LVDDLVAYLYHRRLQDCVTSYDNFTNNLMLAGTEEAETGVVVKPGTTCGRLLGMSVGERATLSDDFRFALTAGSVVNLTRTS
jgi:hypothetical protein